MQNLTEENILERDTLFFEMLDNFVDYKYDIEEDYVMTEEDAYILSIIYDYFIECYNFPTYQDLVLEDITGYDINDKLYEEISSLININETVGTFVAGAIHGLRNMFYNQKKKSAKSRLDAARAREKASSQKVKEYTNKVNGVKKTPSVSSPISDAQKEYRKQKQSVLVKKADQAKMARKTAGEMSQKMSGKLTYSKQKTADLANRVDTGIQNIKNKAKQAIHTGASKIGGIMGKAAGHLGI